MPTVSTATSDDDSSSVVSDDEVHPYFASAFDIRPCICVSKIMVRPTGAPALTMASSSSSSPSTSSSRSEPAPPSSQGDRISAPAIGMRATKESDQPVPIDLTSSKTMTTSTITNTSNSTELAGMAPVRYTSNIQEAMQQEQLDAQQAIDADHAVGNIASKTTTFGFTPAKKSSPCNHRATASATQRSEENDHFHGDDDNDNDDNNDDYNNDNNDDDNNDSDECDIGHESKDTKSSQRRASGGSSDHSNFFDSESQQYQPGHQRRVTTSSSTSGGKLRDRRPLSDSSLAVATSTSGQGAGDGPRITNHDITVVSHIRAGISPALTLDSQSTPNLKTNTMLPGSQPSTGPAPSQDGEGELQMEALVAQKDWSQTPLGPQSSWPAELQMMILLIMRSESPLAIYWGEECILIYNDVWRPILKQKHPLSLGAPGATVWSEIWDVLGVQIAEVRRSGRGSDNKGLRLDLHREGYQEECYFDFTFSPIFVQDGSVGGILAFVQEVTKSILSQRRLKTLNQFSKQATLIQSENGAYSMITKILNESNNPDVTFSILYQTKEVSRDYTTPLDEAFSPLTTPRLRACQDPQKGVSDPSFSSFSPRPATVRSPPVSSSNKRDKDGRRAPQAAILRATSYDRNLQTVENGGEKEKVFVKGTSTRHIPDSLLITPEEYEPWDTAGPICDDPWAWPVQSVLADGVPRLVTLPKSTHKLARALVLPILENPSMLDSRITTVLIVGINPYQMLDNEYLDFLALLVGSIGSLMHFGRVRENERMNAQALFELNKAKISFFQNVSHELRTPLTLMLAPLEDVLILTPEDAPTRPNLEMIQRNTRRLLKLVNTLLQFSRIEAGRSHAMFEETDLAKYTRDISANFESVARGFHLDFTVDCQPLDDLQGGVWVDQAMWSGILLNLVGNAFKHTWKGGVTVRQYPCIGPGGKAGVALEVVDTGVGISPEHLPTLFGRFNRIESKQSRSHEGTGIGLSLVKELTEIHGGTVGVMSKVDVGSTFRLWIPAGRDHHPSSQVKLDDSTDFDRGQPQILNNKTDPSMFTEEASQWISHKATPGSTLSASGTDSNEEEKADDYDDDLTLDMGSFRKGPPAEMEDYEVSKMDIDEGEFSKLLIEPTSNLYVSHEHLLDTIIDSADHKLSPHLGPDTAALEDIKMNGDSEDTIDSSATTTVATTQPSKAADSMLNDSNVSTCTFTNTATVTILDDNMHGLMSNYLTVPMRDHRQQFTTIEYLPPTKSSSEMNDNEAGSTNGRLFRMAPSSPPSSAVKAATSRSLFPKSKVRRGFIVVVDDNNDMRTYLREILGKEFRVQCAVDGVDAMRMIKERLQEGKRIDLVLSDVAMPNMNGYELLSKLRSDPRTMTTPFILLSARAGEEANVEGLDRGADDCMVKPFSARELMARVRSSIRLSDLRRELFREQRHALELKQLIYSISVRIRSGLSLPQILDTASRELFKVIRCNAIRICRFRSVDPETKQHWVRFVSEIVRTGKPKVMSQVEHLLPAGLQVSEEGIGEELQEQDIELKQTNNYQHPVYGAKSFISVALFYNRRIWGYLLASRDAEMEDWSQSEKLLFEQTATQISLAIAHASLWEQKKLQQVEVEAALAANEAKSQILANTSHELRTPIGAIVGALSALEDTDINLTGEQRDMVKIMQITSDVALSVINDLLDTAKLESGTMMLCIKDCPTLLDTLEQSVRIFADKAGRKEVDLVMEPFEDRHGLEYSIRAGQQTIWTDGDRLQQVIMNLIGNAVKFTSAGKVVVQCLLERTETDSSSSNSNKHEMERVGSSSGGGNQRSSQRQRPASPTAQNASAKSPPSSSSSISSTASKSTVASAPASSAAPTYSQQQAKYLSHRSVPLPPDSQVTQAMIRFEVTDTGIGIDPDFLKNHIFQSFAQVDQTMTRRFGGTGLGLAISKHLVMMNGGILGVTSEVGQGSVFYFTWPIMLVRNKDVPLSTPGGGVVPSPLPNGAMTHPLASSRLLTAGLALTAEAAGSMRAVVVEPVVEARHFLAWILHQHEVVTSEYDSIEKMLQDERERTEDLFDANGKVLATNYRPHAHFFFCTKLGTADAILQATTQLVEIFQARNAARRQRRHQLYDEMQEQRRHLQQQQQQQQVVDHAAAMAVLNQDLVLSIVLVIFSSPQGRSLARDLIRKIKQLAPSTELTIRCRYILKPVKVDRIMECLQASGGSSNSHHSTRHSVGTGTDIPKAGSAFSRQPTKQSPHTGSESGSRDSEGENSPVVAAPSPMIPIKVDVENLRAPYPHVHTPRDPQQQQQQHQQQHHQLRRSLHKGTITRSGFMESGEFDKASTCNQNTPEHAIATGITFSEDDSDLLWGHGSQQKQRPSSHHHHQQYHHRHHVVRAHSPHQRDHHHSHHTQSHRHPQFPRPHGHPGSRRAQLPGSGPGSPTQGSADDSQFSLSETDGQSDDDSKPARPKSQPFPPATATVVGVKGAAGGSSGSNGTSVGTTAVEVTGGSGGGRGKEEEEEEGEESAVVGGRGGTTTHHQSGLSSDSTSTVSHRRRIWNRKAMEFSATTTSTEDSGPASPPSMPGSFRGLTPFPSASLAAGCSLSEMLMTSLPTSTLLRRGRGEGSEDSQAVAVATSTNVEEEAATAKSTTVPATGEAEGAATTDPSSATPTTEITTATPTPTLTPTPTTAAFSPRAARAAAGKHERRGMTVLCVEDNIINLRVVQYQLEKLGFDTRSAPDGQVAVDMIKEQIIALGQETGPAEVVEPGTTVTVIGENGDAPGGETTSTNSTEIPPLPTRAITGQSTPGISSTVTFASPGPRALEVETVAAALASVTAGVSTTPASTISTSSNVVTERTEVSSGAGGGRPSHRKAMASAVWDSLVESIPASSYQRRGEDLMMSSDAGTDTEEFSENAATSAVASAFSTAVQPRIQGSGRARPIPGGPGSGRTGPTSGTTPGSGGGAVTHVAVQVTTLSQAQLDSLESSQVGHPTPPPLDGRSVAPTAAKAKRPQGEFGQRAQPQPQLQPPLPIAEQDPLPTVMSSALSLAPNKSASSPPDQSTAAAAASAAAAIESLTANTMTTRLTGSSSVTTTPVPSTGTASQPALRDAQKEPEKHQEQLQPQTPSSPPPTAAVPAAAPVPVPPAPAPAPKPEIDLILMDCAMPVKSGFEAASEIRQMGQFSSYAASVPIIALTASAVESTKEKCLASGMNGYLSKPTKLKDLEGMLNQWVQK
ncbi:hypothetical protein DFQ27_006515 [Actinomortierella ambigua]|uniref:histidine kinase n=1 Tax=Actinomortierella ambigua TaxID=1343610 RepID=A0A9P6U100_9FUNG|nr:hypothetical protein DFQ27_006515 [Actinomortierella ambigua]